MPPHLPLVWFHSHPPKGHPMAGHAIGIPYPPELRADVFHVWNMRLSCVFISLGLLTFALAVGLWFYFGFYLGSQANLSPAQHAWRDGLYALLAGMAAIWLLLAIFRKWTANNAAWRVDYWREASDELHLLVEHAHLRAEAPLPPPASHADKPEEWHSRVDETARLLKRLAHRIDEKINRLPWWQLVLGPQPPLHTRP